nr:MAG: hypothetical protein [Microvirus sp.]
MDNLGRFKTPRKKGQTPFTDTTDRCERLGYVPSNQRIASLIAAGLNLQVTRDQLYDVITNVEKDLVADLPPLPPIRRHLDYDLADLSQISRQYSYQKRVLEERVRARMLEEREKQAKGVSQNTPKPEPEPPQQKP